MTKGDAAGWAIRVATLKKDESGRTGRGLPTIRSRGEIPTATASPTPPSGLAPISQSPYHRSIMTVGWKPGDLRYSMSQQARSYNPRRREVVMPVFQFIAVLATTLFSGAAIYINLVEHPARMECSTALAATVFGPSYRRAAAMQAALALVATTGAIGAWFMGAAVAWLVGALLIFAVVPFTLLVILPTNKKLLDPAIDRTSETVQRLLQHWGRLHAVRSVLSLAASILLLASLLFSSPRP
jgi:uncharacterized membrane protein